MEGLIALVIIRLTGNPILGKMSIVEVKEYFVYQQVVEEGS